MKHTFIFTHCYRKLCFILFEILVLDRLDSCRVIGATSWPKLSEAVASILSRTSWKIDLYNQNDKECNCKVHAFNKFILCLLDGDMIGFELFIPVPEAQG